MKISALPECWLTCRLNKPEDAAAEAVADRQKPPSVSRENRLQWSVTHRLNESRKDQWGATLETLDPEDQSLLRMTKRVMRFPTPSPPLFTPGGIALSDSEKAEALADNLKTHFQPVTDPSVPAVIEMVNVAL